MAYPRLDKFGNPTNMYTEEELKPGQSPKIEDKIMDTLIDNEYLLFPENAANVDRQSLNALQKMYDFDMENNSGILGEVSFSEYLKSVNPKLIEQRANLNRESDAPYIGPQADFSKNIQDELSELGSAGEAFRHDYELLKTSAIRAHDTLDKMTRELPRTIKKSKTDVKNRMLIDE